MLTVNDYQRIAEDKYILILFCRCLIIDKLKVRSDDGARTFFQSSLKRTIMSEPNVMAV